VAVVRVDVLEGLQHQLKVAQDALRETQDQSPRGHLYTLEEAVAVIQAVASIARGLQATPLPSTPTNGYGAAAVGPEPPPGPPLHNPFAAMLGQRG
jgi:hypothetical protein